MRRLIPLLTALPLAACGGTVARPVSVSERPAALALNPVGLERVMGQDAAQLTRLFGQADAEAREGDARKLQYVGRFCVLDAYLYPKAGGTPRVTWIDAREPDGSPIDRASCVAALTRREGGK